MTRLVYEGPAVILPWLKESPHKRPRVKIRLTLTLVLVLVSLPGRIVVDLAEASTMWQIRAR